MTKKIIMKKPLYLLLFAALVSAAVVSCTKENLQEKNQEENPIVQLRSSAEFPANADNPFDYYGLIHNQAVKAYIASGANDTDLEKVVEANNTLLLEATDFNEYFNNGDLASSEMLEPFVDKFPENMEEVIVAGGASDQVQAKLAKFTNHFLEAMEGDEITYDEVYDYIVDFESNILAEKSWSAEDREHLLSATSVGRYSFYLWSNEQKAEDKGKGDVKANLQAKRPWWNWVVIGVADVGGAVLAGVGTGVSASSLANNLTKEENK